MTVHARVGLTASQLAVLSCEYSEKMKCQDRMSDSFITFALKAHAALGKELAHSTTNIKQAKLNDLGLKFGASPIHKGMMLAIGYATDSSKLCSESLEIMRRIDATYGKECVGGYSKLACIVKQCQQEADEQANMTEALVLYFFQWLQFQLKHNEILPSCVTMEWLIGRGGKKDTKRKGEEQVRKLSAIQKCMAKRDLVLNNIASWVEDMRRAAGDFKDITDDMEKVLLAFANYEIFEKTFPACSGEAADTITSGPRFPTSAFKALSFSAFGADEGT